jgi:predicted Ser/Thr protein kinase
MNLKKRKDKIFPKNEDFMASVANNVRPSIFPLSSELPTQKVGSKYSIDLPIIDIARIGRTIGKKIAQGGFGGIYKVNGSMPQRVYKIIGLDQFANGNEIRIAKIAAELGVAPAFYGACVVKQGADQFVFMEMDFAGKSLFRWMEDLAQEADVTKAALVEESSSQKAREAAMKELMERKDDSGMGYTVVAVEQTPSLSMEAAVDKLYPSREAFFFQLFSTLKQLAEKNIAYMDTNCGNLIPNQEKELQLIDFDSAKFLDSPEEAADYLLRGMYNDMHFKDFRALSDLSDESRELIRWFQTQQMAQLIKQFSQAV